MCSYVDIIGGQFVFFERVQYMRDTERSQSRKIYKVYQNIEGSDRTKNDQTIAPIDNEPNKQDKEWWLLALTQAGCPVEELISPSCLRP